MERRKDYDRFPVRRPHTSFCWLIGMGRFQSRRYPPDPAVEAWNVIGIESYAGQAAERRPADSGLVRRAPIQPFLLLPLMKLPCPTPPSSLPFIFYHRIPTALSPPPLSLPMMAGATARGTGASSDSVCFRRELFHRP